MATRTYNSKKVTMAVGNHIVSGYAADSFVTIEETGDGITSEAGADGEVVRSISPDPRHTVKISLMQNSPTNKFLLEQYKKDKTDATGSFPLLIKDLTSEEVFSADESWVVKKPTFSRGKAAGTREWELCAVGEFE